MAKMSQYSLEIMVLLEEFLDELEETTGVSRAFLEAARPIVLKLFTDVPECDRPEMAEKIKETVSHQAQAEQRMELARELMETEDRIIEGQPEVDGQTDGLAANTYLANYGGFGDKGVIQA